MANFNKKELAESLNNILKENPNKKHIVALFVEMLSESSEHLDMFIHANMGVIPDTKYKVGDEVYVTVGSVTDYSWDTNYMIEKKIIINNHVKATITHVNPWSYYPYTVAFLAKSNHEKKETLKQKGVRDTSVQSEQFPEAEDLPF